MKPKLYYGRPINIKGSELDRILLQKVIDHFPGWEIEDSGLAKHSEGYQRFKREKGNGMHYYFQEVLPYCRGGVFLRFRDKKWGAGVYGEAEFFVNFDQPIWVISPAGDIEKETLEKVEVLSIEQTRARLYDASGNLIPY